MLRAEILQKFLAIANEIAPPTRRGNFQGRNLGPFLLAVVIRVARGGIGSLSLGGMAKAQDHGRSNVGAARNLALVVVSVVVSRSLSELRRIHSLSCCARYSFSHELPPCVFGFALQQSQPT